MMDPLTAAAEGSDHHQDAEAAAKSPRALHYDSDGSSQDEAEDVAMLSFDAGVATKQEKENEQDKPQSLKKAGAGIQNHRELWRLYVSHAMTAWTMRMWEFAVSLMLMAVQPDSMLLPYILQFVLAAAVTLCSTHIGMSACCAENDANNTLQGALSTSILGS